MKTIFTLIVFLSGFYSFSQNPSIQWQRSLGGSGMDFSTCIQQTSDGGYVVTGSSSSNDGDVTGNHGGGDYWVAKLDIAGVLQWQKCYGGTGDDYPSSIIQTADGGYVISGATTSTNGDVIGNYGYQSLWTIKINAAGLIKWQNIILNSSRYSSLQQTADGGFVIVGSVGNSSNNSDFALVKLDSIGNTEWSQSYGGSNNDVGFSVQQTADHGYILAGETKSNDGDVTGYHGGYDYWVVKTDSLGILQWQKTLGGTQDDYANSIVQSNDGGYVIAGISRSSDGDVSANYGSEDYWIVKLGGSGNIKWQKNYGGSGDDQAFCVRRTADNGYVIGGAAYTFNDGDVSGGYDDGDYWLLRIDSIGNKLGQIAIGGTSIEESWFMTQTADGGYAMTGYSYSNDGDVSGHHSVSDFWIVKLDANVGIEEKSKIAPELGVYPNPAINVINIYNKDILMNNPIVTVRNCLGALVLTSNSVNEIDVSSLKSGCYILELEANNSLYHSKFIKE